MSKLRVKQWISYQHYKDRAPPWIKLHKSLLDNYEYQCLPVASRALAPMLWLLASESKDGEIDANVRMIAFRLRCSEQEILDGLIPLIENGFILDDSSVLARCKQVAIVETERETEREREGETEKTLVEPASPSQPSAAKKIRFEIFEFWQSVTGHRQSKFNDKTDKVLKARLSEGFTPDDLKSAIRGMWKTPHNRGENDRQTVYDSLELVCRDGAQVNRFMQNDLTMPDYGGRIAGLSQAGNETARNISDWLNQSAEQTYGAAEQAGDVYEGDYTTATEPQNGGFDAF